MQSALVAVQVLATSGEPGLRTIAGKVGLEGTRQSLVEALDAGLTVGAFVTLAELLHRLMPGIRLM
jgi:hypothetical protein